MVDLNIYLALGISLLPMAASDIACIAVITSRVLSFERRARWRAGMNAVGLLSFALTLSLLSKAARVVLCGSGILLFPLAWGIWVYIGSYLEEKRRVRKIVELRPLIETSAPKGPDYQRYLRRYMKLRLPILGRVEGVDIDYLGIFDRVFLYRPPNSERQEG